MLNAMLLYTRYDISEYSITTAADLRGLYMFNLGGGGCNKKQGRWL